MDRRRFLSTSMLSGLGIGAIGAALTSSPAAAFTDQKCATYPGSLPCTEILRHHTLLAQLDAALAARGLDPQQRQAVLAKATCPFCGQLLIG